MSYNQTKIGNCPYITQPCGTEDIIMHLTVISDSLFAHILLDAELQGFYGLQGNQFINTIGYLDDFLVTYFQGLNTAIPEQISQLNSAMNLLVDRENHIQHNLVKP